MAGWLSLPSRQTTCAHEGILFLWLLSLSPVTSATRTFVTLTTFFALTHSLGTHLVVGATDSLRERTLELGCQLRVNEWMDPIDFHDTSSKSNGLALVMAPRCISRDMTRASYSSKHPGRWHQHSCRSLSTNHNNPDEESKSREKRKAQRKSWK